MPNTALLTQSFSRVPKGSGSKELPERYKYLNRKTAAEGIVMLKNENSLLPLKNENVAVFGRVQLDYFYVGNGSGGDVRYPYLVNLMQGIEGRINYNKELAAVYLEWCEQNPAEYSIEWAKWTTHHPEMPLCEEAMKKSATSDIAIAIIGRCAGEDADTTLEQGSFYLTDAETAMLDKVTAAFRKTILIINSGNIIDFSWYKKYEGKIGALLYVWQGGMESGNAIADVLTGAENPGGKLPTAIAYHYEDYPTAKNFGNMDYNNYEEDVFVGYRYFETFAKEAVLFPFGYGLSYTSFSIDPADVKPQMGEDICVQVKVKNMGVMAGTEVVQVYYSAPQGVLGKPVVALAAFGKTKLLAPGEEQTLSLNFPLYFMASYDDAGKTGNKSAYVLEAGDYIIYAGNSSRNIRKAGTVTISELTLHTQLQEAAALDPACGFKRLTTDHTLTKKYEDIPTRTVDLKERILDNLPKEIPQTTGNDYTLSDVKCGKITLEDFVATLNMQELEALTRGDFIMHSKLGAPGNAGVFGGVIESLREKGVVPVTASDGPSGLRLEVFSALLPCGLALSSTWNTELIKELATYQGEELNTKGSHVILAPGMNILRDPLCGRNFEYYAEDPILSGKIAAAMVQGLQTHGKSACPKHFAANNQESNRRINDSRISERALREIYLRGFEICVKEAAPKNLMTSYNRINGVWGHYHYELCTIILREEWGYTGNILTDWWMQKAQDPNFPALTNDAYRIRAQVDVLMPGGHDHYSTDGDGSLLKSYEKEGGITLAEIQRSAVNNLKFNLGIE